MATGWPMKTTYANGDVYSASDVNDITGTINLLGSSVAYTAGKNRIINGDFRFNQRAFSSTTTYGTYGFDRFYLESVGGTVTYSAQTFTAGAAPVSGYEAINFARLVSASQSTNTNYAAINQKIEDVRTFAGQTVTVSFWAKASTGTPNIGITLEQNFGTGGSGPVPTSAAVKTITSSWARYTFTVNVPSISGKTIGTSSFLNLYLFTSVGTSVSASGYAAVGLQNITVDFWGVQVEQGSTATAFQTASGTFGGEFALCQRYYQTVPELLTGPSASGGFSGNAYNFAVFPVVMRVAPTITFFAHDGTSGAVTLYTGTSPSKSSTVANMIAYTWGYSGNFANTASWAITSDYGLLVFKYNSSAEL
jgi:hypothetical protein